MKSSRLITFSCAAALLATATAYASEDPAGHHHEMSTHGMGATSKSEAASAGQPGIAADVSRTIDVIMKDNAYDPSTVSVKAGETIRFKVANHGKLVHEFNIGTAAMHQAHQKEMAMMVAHGVIQAGTLNRDMMSMDMGNGQTMKHDHANSSLLAPGESGDVIWTFSTPTILEFACNVPGHYQSGMKGNFDWK